MISESAPIPKFDCILTVNRQEQYKQHLLNICYNGVGEVRGRLARARAPHFQKCGGGGRGTSGFVFPTFEQKKCSNFAIFVVKTEIFQISAHFARHLFFIIFFPKLVNINL